MSILKHVNPITLPSLATNQKTSSRVTWAPTGRSQNPLRWPTRPIVVWPLVSLLFPSLQSMWMAHSWKSACSLAHTVPAACKVVPLTLLLANQRLLVLNSPPEETWFVTLHDCSLIHCGSPVHSGNSWLFHLGWGLGICFHLSSQVI